MTGIYLKNAFVTKIQNDCCILRSEPMARMNSKMGGDFEVKGHLRSKVKSKHSLISFFLFFVSTTLFLFQTSHSFFIINFSFFWIRKNFIRLRNIQKRINQRRNFVKICVLGLSFVENDVFRLGFPNYSCNGFFCESIISRDCPGGKMSDWDVKMSDLELKCLEFSADIVDIF